MLLLLIIGYGVDEADWFCIWAMQLKDWVEVLWLMELPLLWWTLLLTSLRKPLISLISRYYSLEC